MGFYDDLIRSRKLIISFGNGAIEANNTLDLKYADIKPNNDFTIIAITVGEFEFTVNIPLLAYNENDQYYFNVGNTDLSLSFVK